MALDAALALGIPSGLGRTEYLVVSLAEAPGDRGLRAFPLGKGSGTAAACSQADGFSAVPALDSGVEASTAVSVREPPHAPGRRDLDGAVAGGKEQGGEAPRAGGGCRCLE